LRHGLHSSVAQFFSRARGNSHQLKLTHDVDRIEQMGSDAVIVGTNGNDLQFSAVRLESCEG